MTTPLCRDCRWSRSTIFMREYATCKRVKSYGAGCEMFCKVERNPEWDDISECGSRGLLFEPRRPWYRRLLARWRQRNELDRLKGEIARTK